MDYFLQRAFSTVSLAAYKINMTIKQLITFATITGVLFLESCISKDTSSNLVTQTKTSEIILTSATSTQTPSLLIPTEKGNITPSSVSCPEFYILEKLPVGAPIKSNEEWILYTCSLAKTRYNNFVLSKDNSKVWEIYYNNPAWADKNSIQLSAYRWTQDGTYLYLVPTLNCCGSGFDAPGYFWDNYSLYRLNLQSGYFENIIPPSDKGYSFSISPNDEYLVYSENESKTIHIIDLRTRIEQILSLDEDYVLTGAFAWKPDSTKLYFSSAINGWESEDEGISIFMLSINNMNIQTILFNDNRLLIPLAKQEDGSLWENGNLEYWVNDNLLNIESLDYMSVEYFSRLALDVQSGEVIILSTPLPNLIGSATPKP